MMNLMKNHNIILFTEIVNLLLSYMLDDDIEVTFLERIEENLYHCDPCMGKNYVHVRL